MGAIARVLPERTTRRSPTLVCPIPAMREDVQALRSRSARRVSALAHQLTHQTSEHLGPQRGEQLDPTDLGRRHHTTHRRINTCSSRD